MSKGRSAQYSMLRTSRRVACLLLATASTLAVRWIPSELNIADKPSRKWEHLRRQDVISQSQEAAHREEVLEACYPQKDSDQRLRHAHPDARGFSQLFNIQEAKVSPDVPEGPRGQEGRSALEGAAEGRSSEIQVSNPAREIGGIPARINGLCEEDQRVEAICQDDRQQFKSEVQIRSGLLQVCQQHVRARFRIPRRDKDPCRYHRQLSRLRPPAHVGSNKEGIARLAEGRPSTDPASHSLAPDCHHVPEPAAARSEVSCGSLVADVLGVSSSGRGLGPSDSGPDSSDARQSFFPTTPSPSKSRSTIKSRALRRIPDARLIDPAVVRSSSSKASWTPNLPAGHQLRAAGEAVEMGSKEGRPRRRSCSVVPTTALGSQCGSFHETANPAGSEAKGPLGLGSQCQKIRSSRATGSGIPSSSQTSSGALQQIREDLPEGGPKTFHADVKHEHTGEQYVLEIFSAQFLT